MVFWSPDVPAILVRTCLRRRHGLRGACPQLPPPVLRVWNDREVRYMGGQQAAGEFQEPREELQKAPGGRGYRRLPGSSRRPRGGSRRPQGSCTRPRESSRRPLGKFHKPPLPLPYPPSPPPLLNQVGVFVKHTGGVPGGPEGPSERHGGVPQGPGAVPEGPGEGPEDPGEFHKTRGSSRKPWGDLH